MAFAALGGCQQAYAPNIGRFRQPDPAGYSAGMNLYAYVSGDPINNIDPTGMDPDDDGPPPANYGGPDIDTIEVVGNRYHPTGIGGSLSPGGMVGSEPKDNDIQEIIITANRIKNQTSQSASPPSSNRKSCLVASLEFSFGAQIGGEVAWEDLFKASGKADGGTFRLTFNLSGSSINVTQGLTGALAVGIPDTPIGASLGGKYERSGAVGYNVPASQALANQKFQLGPDGSAGLAFDAGVQLIFGIELKIGYDPTVENAPRCLLEGF